MTHFFHTVMQFLHNIEAGAHDSLEFIASRCYIIFFDRSCGTDQERFFRNYTVKFYFWSARMDKCICRPAGKFQDTDDTSDHT